MKYNLHLIFPWQTKKVYFIANQAKKKKPFLHWPQPVVFQFISKLSLRHTFFYICHSYSWVLPSNITHGFLSCWKLKTSRLPSELSTTLNRLLMCLQHHLPLLKLDCSLLIIILSYELHNNQTLLEYLM